MKYFHTIKRQEKGFTLIELIMIIVLLGILGVSGADFISTAFKGFKATESRLEIFEEGKTALARMEREIINSIPNAVDFDSSNNNEIKIGLIAENDMISENVTGRYEDPDPTTFIDDRTGQLSEDTIISINNTNWLTFTNPDISIRRLYTVNTLTSPPPYRMNLSTVYKGIKGIAVESRSTKQRFYAVDKAVRYYFDAATSELRRTQIIINEEDEDLSDTRFNSIIGKTMATNVTAISFNYTQGVSTRNSVVTIIFEITKNNEAIRFNKEVHARNTP